MAWPKDTQEELRKFYGAHALRADGRPTAVWERDHLKTIDLPYPMLLAWDLSKQVRKLTCHKLAADSVERIFAAILAHYGTLDAIKQARMHLFGGCYNYRRVAGSGRLSTHAWGAGIDLDPDRNPMGKEYDESDGMMPLAVVEIFEAEGWAWGGRFKNRIDAMHFQATQ
jgi:hypothetical protein